jgi:hypothetical protein
MLSALLFDVGDATGGATVVVGVGGGGGIGAAGRGAAGLGKLLTHCATCFQKVSQLYCRPLVS